MRDITFHTFNGYNPKGELTLRNEKEGLENFWATKEEIRKSKTFPGFWDREGGLSWLDIPAKPQDNTKVRYLEKMRFIKGF